MALNNIFLKIFILNSSYVTVNFQGVMVQLVPREGIRQTNLGIQLRTLTGRHFHFWWIRLVQTYLEKQASLLACVKTHRSKRDGEYSVSLPLVNFYATSKQNACFPRYVCTFRLQSHVGVFLQHQTQYHESKTVMSVIHSHCHGFAFDAAETRRHVTAALRRNYTSACRLPW